MLNRFVIILILLIIGSTWGLALDRFGSGFYGGELPGTSGTLLLGPVYFRVSFASPISEAISQPMPTPAPTPAPTPVPTATPTLMVEPTLSPTPIITSVPTQSITLSPTPSISPEPTASASVASGESISTAITYKASSEISVVGEVLHFPSPYSPTKNGSIAIQYTLSTNTDIDIYVFSVSGGLVKRISTSSGSEGGKGGQNTITWNGSLDGGGIIGNGIYVATIVSRNNGKLLKRFKINVFD